MKIVMITVGNPNRLTGGYLYHKQVYAILAQMEVPISEIAPGKIIQNLAGQRKFAIIQLLGSLGDFCI